MVCILALQVCNYNTISTALRFRISRNLNKLIHYRFQWLDHILLAMLLQKDHRALHFIATALSLLLLLLFLLPWTLSSSSQLFFFWHEIIALGRRHWRRIYRNIKKRKEQKQKRLWIEESISRTVKCIQQSLYSESSSSFCVVYSFALEFD